MSEGEEKKIIIDEDWKSQVEAEKEAAQNPDKSEADAEMPAEMPENLGGEEDMELPPASLLTLVSSLMSQALYALGQLPGADGAAAKPQLNLARHVIDSIGVLQEKTAGNCTDEEAQMLGDVLHQLRMGYVAIEQQGTTKQQGKSDS